MNILYVADPGSIHDVRWINYFAAKVGLNCFVIVRKVHSRNLDYCGKLDKRVRLVATIDDPSTIRVFSTYFQILKMRAVIRKFAIDLIHFLYAEPNALWAQGRRLFGVPLMLTTHGTDVLKTIPAFFEKKDVLSRLVARQYRKAMQGFDAIVCTSQSQINSVAKINSKVNDVITLVRMGVDFGDLVDSDDNTGSLAIEKPFVLMPRNMKQIYNHDFTLDSIALLSESIRKKYAFVFINSGDGNNEYFCKIYERSRSITADIRFLPRLEHKQLLRLMRQASLVVMNPKSDGSPATAMEAMACKSPLILPPLPYDQDIFGEAFFFEAWNPDALKNLIETVLHMSKPELESRVDANFARVAGNGDFNSEMLKVQLIYERLVIA